MTKAIFFDVDGTLVSFKTHQISPAVRQALQALRERGIKLFLSTGRHLAMLDPVRQVFDFDGYVTLSGQYCTLQHFSDFHYKYLQQFFRFSFL